MLFLNFAGMHFGSYTPVEFGALLMKVLFDSRTLLMPTSGGCPSAGLAG
jgi:hypothetical protein